MRLTSLIAVVLCLTTSVSAFASDVKSSSVETPNFESMIFRLLVWTVFLLAILGGLFWFSKRVNKTSRPGAKSGGMEFIGSTPLNRKCALHVIEANGQRVVIATDLTGIREMVPVAESFSSVLENSSRI